MVSIGTEDLSVATRPDRAHPDWARGQEDTTDRGLDPEEVVQGPGLAFARDQEQIVASLADQLLEFA